MEFVGSLVPYLAAFAVRSLALAAIAPVAIYLLRLKAAAAQHAVWTAVVAGMLFLPALGELFPTVSLRMLRPSPAMQPSGESMAPIDNPAVTPAAPTSLTQGAWKPARLAAPTPVRQAPTLPQTAGALYLAGLAAFLCMLASGYCSARRLVSSSVQIDCLAASGIFESTWISVPVTVGFLRPKILLPAVWREWPAEKLQAVLAHERTHVERADWAIAVAAGINRRLFWFHPLAWWLERHLAVLAERACDDAALLELGSRESYAQTLLDMAAAVQSGRGRMLGEAIAMAKTAEVRKRIERILDETRQIPRGLTRARWVTLAACGLPLVYVASVTQLAPAQEIHVAPQAVTTPQQSVLPKPDGPTALVVPPNTAVKPPAPFRRLFGAPGRRFFFHDTPHADPIVTPPPVGRQRERFRFYNNQDLQVLNSAAAAAHGPAMHLAFLPQVAPIPAAPPPEQVNIKLEVDASSQSPYPYRFKMGATLLHQVFPIYPVPAKAAGIQGDVKLNVVIGTDGHVLSVLPLEGNPLLEAAAMDAVRQYIYQPRTLPNGERAEVETTVTIPFRLEGSAVAYEVKQENLHYEEAHAAAAQSPGNSPPRLILKVEPEYPMEARAAQLQGTVTLSVTIGPDGIPQKLVVLQSADSTLDAQAVNAVRQWKFRPGYQAGQPVDYAATIQITFRLL
jgi:TonB family protein